MAAIINNNQTFLHSQTTDKHYSFIGRHEEVNEYIYITDLYATNERFWALLGILLCHLVVLVANVVTSSTFSVICGIAMEVSAFLLRAIRVSYQDLATFSSITAPYH